MKFLFLILLLGQAPTGTANPAIPVRHDHAFGSCTGNLIFSDDGVRYDTPNEEHARSWSYPDVRFFELASNDRIEIHTYENHGPLGLWRERTFAFEITGFDTAEAGIGQELFEARDVEIGRNLYQLLLEKSPRPVLNRLASEATALAGAAGRSPDAAVRLLQDLPVKHNHFFGGCQGRLTIWDDTIMYVGDDPEHLRIWPLEDLVSFASTGDFDLRLSTSLEEFHFDLKLPLNQMVYQHLWNAVYSPDLQSYQGRTR